MIITCLKLTAQLSRIQGATISLELIAKEGGDNRLFIYVKLVPKVLFRFLIFVGALNNFDGLSLIFYCLGFIKLCFLTFQPLIVIYRRLILCDINGDVQYNVHQCIVHCLIPLNI